VETFPEVRQDPYRDRVGSESWLVEMVDIADLELAVENFGDAFKASGDALSIEFVGFKIVSDEIEPGVHRRQGHLGAMVFVARSDVGTDI
jgi:hypothetical protein